MIKDLKIAFLLILSVFVISCQSDKSEENTKSPDSELTVESISDTCWTYISLDRNEFVGTSPLDSPESDEKWRQRSDWDIAICGDMLRTNSGTSGIGYGGIVRIDDATYESLDKGSFPTLDIDRLQTPAAERK